MISTECCTSGLSFDASELMSRDSHEFDMAFSFGRCTSWCQLSTNEVEGKAGSTSFCTKWPWSGESEGCVSIVSYYTSPIQFRDRWTACLKYSMYFNCIPYLYRYQSNWLLELYALFFSGFLEVSGLCIFSNSSVTTSPRLIFLNFYKGKVLL